MDSCSSRPTVDASSRHDSKVDKVLCVGMSCVDIINVVAEFPKEDSDTRGIKTYWQRGGNATNSCTILSLMSVPCEFMGVLGNKGPEASWLKEDFEACGIDISHCVIKPVQCPISTSILSQATGSRTILFYPRDRPELTATEFHEQFNSDFSQYSWIYFELCSNVEEVLLMIEEVAAYNENTSSRVIISLEVEKPELKNYEPLMKKADVVFISKDIAMHRGYSNAEEAVCGLSQLCKVPSLLVCAWGDRGAASRCNLGEGGFVTTSPPLQIQAVDSLGAGDTFLAGVIGKLLTSGFKRELMDDVEKMKEIVPSAMNFAVRLAGHKCTMFGYGGLKEILNKKQVV